MSIPTVIGALVLGLVLAMFIRGPNQGFSVSPRRTFKHSEFDRNTAADLRIGKIYDDIQGPESVIFNARTNDIYVGIENGTVLQISEDATRKRLVHTPGRPIGGAVDSAGNGLYLCVPPVGLLYVSFADHSMRLVSAISDDNIPIRFVDDAAVASDGKVYFTDASNVAPVLNKEGHYDVLVASLLDGLAGSGTGRLLCYDPATGVTTTLMNRLMFANGVAISKDQSYVLVAESYAFRVQRYYLTGHKKGVTDVFAAALPGMPDGLDTAPGGGFNVAIVSEVSRTYKVISSSSILKYLFAYMKPSLIPNPDPFAAIIKLNDAGEITRSFVDFEGKSSYPVTSVTEVDGGYFVGSLRNNFIGFFYDRSPYVTESSIHTAPPSATVLLEE